MACSASFGVECQLRNVMQVCKKWSLDSQSGSAVGVKGAKCTGKKTSLDGLLEGPQALDLEM